MNKILLAILAICLLFFIGCVSSSEHEVVVEANLALTEEVNQLTTEIDSLNLALENKHPRLFLNRNEIEEWLEQLPKPTVPSADVDEWFIYAMYFQDRAAKDGYIISISYTIIDDSSLMISCDIITEDGNIYYFNPDNGILKDSSIRVPVEDYDLDSLVPDQTTAKLL